MPADERYDVAHEANKIDDSFRNGCHTTRNKGKRFQEGGGYYAPQRKFYPDGRFEVLPVWIEYRMSGACRNFYLWETSACKGCMEPKDFEYAEAMGGKR